MDELFRYVQERIRQGYSPAQIKQSLVSQGYSPAVVEGVVDSVSSRAEPASRPASSGAGRLVFIGVFLAIALVSVFTIPSFFKSPLLDVKLNPYSEIAYPGQDVQFDMEVINMGSKERFDVEFSYRVLNVNNDLITQKEETIAISTSTSYHKRIAIPDSTRPGQYTLKAFARYDDKTASSSFTFDVEKAPVVAPKESCQDKIRNQDETGVDCGGVCGGYWYDGECHAAPKTQTNTQTPVTKESCDDGIRNQDEAGTDCGGVCGGYWYDSRCNSAPKPIEKSTAVLIMEASQLAKEDPDAAKEACLSLETVEVQDNCLKRVAQSAMQSEYCELIVSDNDRDLCYYPFFMQGDYSVCEKLVLKESLQTCAQLRELSKISQ